MFDNKCGVAGCKNKCHLLVTLPGMFTKPFRESAHQYPLCKKHMAEFEELSSMTDTGEECAKVLMEMKASAITIDEFVDWTMKVKPYEGDTK